MKKFKANDLMEDEKAFYRPPADHCKLTAILHYITRHNGDRFCTSRGWDREMGWGGVRNKMLCTWQPGLAGCRQALVSTKWAIFLFHTNGHTKWGVSF